MQSAQAITADFLDLTESPQRVELIAKKGNKSLHIRSLSELEVGAEYVTERGNKLVRCSPDEAVLAGKVRLPVEVAPVPAESVASSASTGTSSTWQTVSRTHSKLVLNVVKSAADSAIGMRVFNADMGDFAEVLRVTPNGAAAKAGVKVSDLLLAINGQRVRTEEDAAALTAAGGVHVFELARPKKGGKGGPLADPRAREAAVPFNAFSLAAAAREYALPSDAATLVSAASSASGAQSLGPHG
mmetsp:Transcript_43997/g.91903  ORF Transcript_43997/g.91903 Transcript_43997/m.91903 type:complete len:243 (-) Transcript_43997:335-1063(-)